MRKMGDPIQFEVKKSEESFETWINKPFIPEKLRTQLREANALIIPQEEFRNKKVPLFPVGTEELFRYLKDNSDERIVTDICIDDPDYKELALHSDLLILGGFILSTVVLPVFVNLISEYVKNRWISSSSKPEIRIEVTVVKSGGDSIKCNYEGPADKYKDTIMSTFRTLKGKEGKALNE